MVKLRLRRIGKKKHPVYKLVAADSRSPRDGGYLEALGNYDPNFNPIAVSFKEERVFYWLRKGAQPTDTVRSLLRRNGLWLRWSLMKRGADDVQMKNIVERWEMARADKSEREAERKARRVERKRQAAGSESEAPAAESSPAEAPTTE